MLGYIRIFPVAALRCGRCTSAAGSLESGSAGDQGNFGGAGSEIISI